jgi:hypothetical protein
MSEKESAEAMEAKRKRRQRPTAAPKAHPFANPHQVPRRTRAHPAHAPHTPRSHALPLHRAATPST